MEFKVYKLEFSGAVHFGRKNLEDGEYTFCADTLFSALCQEALKMGKDMMERLLWYVKNGQLLFSDAFPYMGDTYYLPKPMKRVDSGRNTGDSVTKKAYKKLNYIPAQEMGNYLAGQYDVVNAEDMDKLGYFQMRVSAAIRGEDEAKPFRVGSYYYRAGNGLYIIVGYEGEEIAELAEKLLENLSMVGIGGKRASGMGRFVLQPGTLPGEMQKRLGGEGGEYMTLSVSLPTDAELEAALDGARYILCKRSGFVDSDQYAKEIVNNSGFAHGLSGGMVDLEQYAKKQRRKRDLYVLKTGACLKHKFLGDVYDVADGHGSHAVYRYAKPMFMEVDA